jgi:hypothetical protein
VTELLAQVLEAAGGTRRWSEVTAVRADVSITGPFWDLKNWPGGLEHVTVEIDPREQRSTFTPFTAPALRSVFRTAPERLSIETLDGAGVESRDRPRESFAGVTRTTAWDRLHLAYFLNYALWNYLTTPFLFTYPGVRTEEIEPWREGDESWRRLRASFPESIATHSDPQVFYFDADFAQRRMDYAPEVIDNSPAAHYTSDHRRFDGIVFPTRRRVYPRDPRTNARQSEQHVIAVDLHTVELRGA